MGEFWDIYDAKKNKTGKVAERGVYKFKKGEYHIVVTGIIINSKGEILITKRAEHKRHGGLWECNGGSILKGETSIQGMIRELKEEIGVEFSEKEAVLLKEIVRDKEVADIKDMWLFRRDIKEEEITFPDGEATDYKWVTIDEFIEMFNNNEIIPNINFGREDYEKALKM